MHKYKVSGEIGYSASRPDNSKEMSRNVDLNVFETTRINYFSIPFQIRGPGWPGIPSGNYWEIL
jgi:hypothetical protein